MKRLTKVFKGGQKGFTLIELLIVIVILGILAAAIIPNLSKFMGAGTVGSANAELASVRTAIGAYQTDHDGKLPTAVGGSVAAGVVLNDEIVSYIVGSNGIKANYTVLADGSISTADPTATNDTGATPWGDPALDWSTDKWIKDPTP